MRLWWFTRSSTSDPVLHPPARPPAHRSLCPHAGRGHPVRRWQQHLHGRRAQGRCRWQRVLRQRRGLVRRAARQIRHGCGQTARHGCVCRSRLRARRMPRVVLCRCIVMPACVFVLCRGLTRVSSVPYPHRPSAHVPRATCRTVRLRATPLLIEFLLGTAFVSADLKLKIRLECDFEKSRVSDACSALLEQMHQQVGACRRQRRRSFGVGSWWVGVGFVSHRRKGSAWRSPHAAEHTLTRTYTWRLASFGVLGRGGGWASFCLAGLGRAHRPLQHLWPLHLRLGTARGQYLHWHPRRTPYVTHTRWSNHPPTIVSTRWHKLAHADTG